MTTIWEIEEHTKAKHRILREWWNGWLPIVAIGPLNQRLIYFDGFAGPGSYVGGEMGSPIIALRSALDHIHRTKFENKELVFIFVERRRDRADMLKAQIAQWCPNVPSSWRVHIIVADFVDALQGIFKKLDEEGAKLAPTFAFLDPFGFRDLPMDLVARIASYRFTDVLITFAERDINRFADSPTHVESIDGCLGGTGWRHHVPERADERRSFFLQTYENEIKTRVRGAHVRSFSVSGQAGPIYYLVGVTKNREGMRVMKRAMWKEDPTGEYRFSDRTAGMTTLLRWEDEPGWIQDAAGDVHARFVGSTATVREVEDFVLFNTPYQWKKAILKKLETEGKVLEYTGAGPKGGLEDNTIVRFR